MQNFYEIDNMYNLPEILSQSETIRLFKDMIKGDNTARNKIIEGNIRLVYYEINRKFYNINCEFSDLVDIGILGLIKAVDSYKLDKNINLSTYALRCIDNQILMYLRKINKNPIQLSLDESCNQEDGLDLEEKLSYEDFEIYNIEKIEINKKIIQVINKLSGTEKELIILKFGFFGNKIHTQRELANKYDVSQSVISRKISIILEKIKRELVLGDFIEIKEKGNNKKR